MASPQSVHANQDAPATCSHMILTPVWPFAKSLGLMLGVRSLDLDVKRVIAHNSCRSWVRITHVANLKIICAHVAFGS